MTVPRVYPILDTAALAKAGVEVLVAAQAMLAGGAEILQFRHKSFWSAEVVELAGRTGEFCRQAGAQFVINDRADYAALLDAGLHVGQEDLAPGDARRVIGSRALLGFSTHNLDQFTAALAEPVDYLAFGPVFPTKSKENPDPVTGLELLSELRLMTPKPLIAIGGITLDLAPRVWSAGADSVAVISDLLPEPCSAAAITARMRLWTSL